MYKLHSIRRNWQISWIISKGSNRGLLSCDNV